MLEGLLSYMIMKKEKCWDLMHHYVFMHREILLHLRWYERVHYKEENNHYIIIML